MSPQTRFLPVASAQHAGTDETRATGAPAPGRVLRLPQREPVALAAQACAILVYLAGRPFHVLNGAPGAAALEDPEGRRAVLREGRNLVGRALFCDVVVDAGYVDVSRSHLVIDVADGRVTRLTDVSSAGTFVERTALGADSNAA